MASKFLPKTAVKIKADAFVHLVRMMGTVLFADTDNDDAYNKLLWAINIGIYREWLAMVERIDDRKHYNCKLDVSQTMAFMDYWAEAAMPAYEAQTLSLLLHQLDRSLNDQRFKRIAL